MWQTVLGADGDQPDGESKKTKKKPRTSDGSDGRDQGIDSGENVLACDGWIEHIDFFDKCLKIWLYLPNILMYFCFVMCIFTFQLINADRFTKMTDVMGRFILQ